MGGFFAPASHESGQTGIDPSPLRSTSVPHGSPGNGPGQTPSGVPAVKAVLDHPFDDRPEIPE